MKSKIQQLILLLLVLFFCSINVRAQTKKFPAPASADKIINPLQGNDASVITGRKIYTQFCVACHGNKGNGDGIAAAGLPKRPADHTSAYLQSQKDGALFWIITAGNNPMPSYKTTLTTTQRWQVINYIRTLANGYKKPKAIVKAPPVPVVKHVVDKPKSLAVTPVEKKDTVVDSSIAVASAEKKMEPIDDTANATAQQTPVAVDSSLIDRIDALEMQTSYSKPGEDHFMAIGLATFGFVSNKTTSSFNGSSQVSKTNSLGDADHFEFSPMFLWRHGKKFLLEFEPSFSADGVGVNWAAVSYFASPGLIVRTGYLVLPFGAYNKRLAAGWINKLASDPEGIPNATDFAIEAEGGFQAGDMKWSYDVAISNGMQLQPDGTTGLIGITDNNKNKTFTGRIGWLPFANSSLEIGASVMTGKVGDAGLITENVNATLWALDVNLVENIKPFQLNIKGQYSETKIDHADYINPTDSSTYTFDNRTKTGYIMAALRPMFVENKIIKNFEVAARYGNYTTPANSLWGTKDNSLSVGLNYWLNWRTVARFSYEAIKGTNTISENIGGTPGAVTKSNSMYLQFAIQL